VVDEGSRVALGIITLHGRGAPHGHRSLRSAGADRRGDDRRPDYRAGGQHRTRPAWSWCGAACAIWCSPKPTAATSISSRRPICIRCRARRAPTWCRRFWRHAICRRWWPGWRDPRFVVRLVAERVSADALCHRLSSLNDLLTLQVIELVAGQFDLPYVPWCWLVFGSEGRLEQTLATDQDNGLIFAAESDAAGGSLRRRSCLSPGRSTRRSMPVVFRCARATSWPATRSGVCPPTSGGAPFPAGWNPATRGLAQFEHLFRSARLYGQESLANDLRAGCWPGRPRYPIFLRAMVENTLNWESPLNWWNGFRYRSGQGVPTHHRSQETRLATLRRRRTHPRAGPPDSGYQYRRAAARHRRTERDGSRTTWRR
jgi:hypothetical protein